MVRRGERGLTGEGPLSGEGETCRLDMDSSVLGERLWLGENSSSRGERLRLGEQLSLLGEKALGDAFHPRRENSALLLPGEAARLLGQTRLGESSCALLGLRPGGSGSGVPRWERLPQLECPPAEGCVSVEQKDGSSREAGSSSSSSSSSSSLSSSSSESSTSEN